MRAEPADASQGLVPPSRTPTWCVVATLLAGVVGLALLVDSLGRSSATYDEVTYLRVASWWWRTGEQDPITRMGSPLTFWKLQQAPVLWILDRAGFAAWVDDPIGYQSRLLPLVRLGSLPAWLIAFALTAFWARALYGPRAMALAAWLFTLSPNLLAHGGLATMEMPLVACTTAMFFLFWRFLQLADRRDFRALAALGGLAFSCKFTVIVLPPLFALLMGFDGWRTGERKMAANLAYVVRKTVELIAIAVLANLIVTGFATLPLSQSSGPHPTVDARFGGTVGRWATRAFETPIPQDWVGFITQVWHQRSGGPSYLLGERRMMGWWWYYFVALAVKAPLSVWLLVGARAMVGRRLSSAGRSWILPAAIVLFLGIAAAGSARNYGVRYLLPLAPLAIVWVSGLAEGGRFMTLIAAVGIAGQAIAVASIHPHELTYFNAIAGGPAGGRRILADSNLDWGQGLRSLARLQRREPELRDLTFYYFGNTRPDFYGVAGISHVVDAGAEQPGLPPRLAASTKYLAVSTSLQWGPWGPPGYFNALNGISPYRMTDDQTIAVYRTEDLGRPVISSSP